MMALMLREGDYVPDGQGGFLTVTGAREVLERVLWKLTVRRGSFPFLPELGSRLYLLGRVPAGQREALAAQYAAEALADEEVTVTGAEWEEERLMVHLLWKGQTMTAAVTVGGLE